MTPLVLVLVAYLVGSLPASYLVSRWGHGVDLRREGSGNLGATNVFRVLGWKAAAPVVVLDIGKGWLPAWAFPQIDSSTASAWLLAYGGAAILGHVFPVWMRFRGGKGVATSCGVFLAAAPAALLAGVAAWVGLVVTTRIVSIASIVSAGVVAGTIWLWPPQQEAALLRGFATALALFVLWAHRDNLRRLLRGEENRFAPPATVNGGSASGGGEERENLPGEASP